MLRPPIFYRLNFFFLKSLGATVYLLMHIIINTVEWWWPMTDVIDNWCHRYLTRVKSRRVTGGGYDTCLHKTWIMTLNEMVAKQRDLYVSPRVYVNEIHNEKKTTIYDLRWSQTLKRDIRALGPALWICHGLSRQRYRIWPGYITMLLQTCIRLIHYSHFDWPWITYLLLFKLDPW